MSITIKFCLTHYWGGANAVLGVGPDRTRALVSMAIAPMAYNSHRVIIGRKCCDHSSAFNFNWISFSFLQVTRTAIKSRKFVQIGPQTAHWRLEKSPRLIMGEML